jgi:hypothetical protein
LLNPITKGPSAAMAAGHISAVSSNAIMTFFMIVSSFFLGWFAAIGESPPWCLPAQEIASFLLLD